MKYWHDAATPEIARTTEGVLVVVVGGLYRKDELLDP
jgi:hypothetical protein